MIIVFIYSQIKQLDCVHGKYSIHDHIFMKELFLQNSQKYHPMKIRTIGYLLVYVILKNTCITPEEDSESYWGHLAKLK